MEPQRAPCNKRHPSAARRKKEGRKKKNQALLKSYQYTGNVPHWHSREMSYEFSLGQAIYISIKPLFKIYLAAGTGFLLSKLKVLNPSSSRVISLIVLNYLIPCLFFHNIVASLKDTDIKIMGVIILTGYIYYAAGALCALIVKLTNPIPKIWVGGLFMASIFNNSGDLPIAYVQTLGQGTMFSSTWANKGVAYCVIFNIVFISGMFNFGGQHLIMFDKYRLMKDKLDHGSPPETITPTQSVIDAHEMLDLEKQPHSPDLDEHPRPLTDQCATSEVRINASSDAVSITVPPGRRFSRSSQFVPSISESATSDEPRPPIMTRFARVKAAWKRFKHKNIATRVVAEFIENLKRPQSVALIVALTIAMIPWVRRLFVDDPDQYIKGIPNAPDGQPILDFIMDYTKFFGNAQVPLGLMLLGATIARLRIRTLASKFWRTIIVLVVFKLVILPIIAIAFVGELRRINWIDSDDPMAPIVLVSSSCTPSATIQIYITSLVFGVEYEEGPLNCLAVVLIAQYLFLPITMTIVMTYSLKNIV